MPQFAPSSVHRATVTLTNPKTAGFDYVADLCMGAEWTVMATASFHLAGGELKPVDFQVSMPSVTGTYPVFIRILCGGVVVGTFTATEDVVIAYSIEIINFLVIYNGYMVRDLWDMNFEQYSKVTHLGFTLRNGGTSDIRGVSVKARITPLFPGQPLQELSPPLDESLRQIAQPFTLEPGRAGKDIFFDYRFPGIIFTETTYVLYVEIAILGKTVITDSLSFILAARPPLPPSISGIPSF